jgi:hypothetical protein
MPFLFQKGEIFDHLVRADGIKPDEKKIVSIKNFPTPAGAKAVESFLGLVGYYRRFIPNFEMRSSSLTRLVKKG